MKLVKSKDLEEREEENPDNIFTIGDESEKNKTLDNLINEGQQSLNWDKISPLIRHEGQAPPMIMDNIEEVINANVIGVKARNLPSRSDLSVLTSYFDPNSRKWLEAKRASHPFISVKMIKINPRRNNKEESSTTT